jgi:alpha-1,3-rhamnosyl/mannosyltransferase
MVAAALLDATPLAGGHAARGIGQVVRGLVGAFARRAPEERPALLLARGQAAVGGFAARRVRWPAWRVPRVPDPWPALHVERVARARGEPLFHATHAGLTPAGPGVVVTLHDLIPAAFPRLYLAGPGRLPERRAYEAFLRRLRAADRVLAVSRATADDAVRLAGVDPARIRVVPNGLPAVPEPRGATPAAPYVLYSGAVEPHKNLEVVLDALALARARTRLVATGPWSPRRLERLRRRAERRGVAGRVDWLGHVPAAWLAALRRDAVAVVVPSRKEGFGLPALEGLAAGVPVLAADVPALREVAGEAALYLDPDDPHGWAAAIARAQEDGALRERAAAAGPARAAGFTWDESVRLTLAAYAELTGA